MRRGWGLVGIAALCGACAGRTRDSADLRTGDGDGAGGTTADAASQVSTGGLARAGTGGAPAEKRCGAESREVGSYATDYYFVLDASAAMLLSDDGGPSRWAIATEALRSFVEDPHLYRPSLRFGLWMSPGQGDAGCSPGAPEVDIGSVPDGGLSFVPALSARTPGGRRNVVTALRSAVEHLEARATTLSRPVAVLVTGGPSDACDTTSVAELLATVRNAAQGTPTVRTAVIVLGDDLPELDAVARAGITGAVFRVPLTGDTTRNLAEALLSLTSWFGCAFDVPRPVDPARPLNPDWLGLYLTPNSTQVTESVPKLGRASDCALNQNAGWYFDDPLNPTEMRLCPGTCERTATAQLEPVVCPSWIEQTR